MKTFFVGSLLMTVVYLLMLPFSQYFTLRWANRELNRGNLDEARVVAEGVQDEWPTFFPARTKALQERIARVHFSRTTGSCRQGDYDVALQGFQLIATLAYPDRILSESKKEEEWCRLQYAQRLTQDGWHEGAIDHLTRLVGSQNGAVRAAALKKVTFVVEHEVDSWLRRGQYMVAFEKLGERERTFGGQLEIAPLFYRLERKVEVRVFGVPLVQECRENPQVSQGKVRVPVSTLSSPYLNGAAKKINFVATNEIKQSLQVLLRGAEQRDLRLEPNGKKELWLEPGEYLVGAFSPKNCRFAPLRTSWRLEPFMLHNFRFVEG